MFLFLKYSGNEQRKTGEPSGQSISPCFALGLNMHLNLKRQYFFHGIPFCASKEQEFLFHITLVCAFAARMIACAHTQHNEVNITLLALLFCCSVPAFSICGIDDNKTVLHNTVFWGLFGHKTVYLQIY